MKTPRPTVNVVEVNPFAPRPFVFTEVAICLCDAIRAAGYESNHLVNEAVPSALSIVLGASPASLPEGLLHLDPRTTALFNFEQLDSKSALAGPEYRRWLRDWVVADYHLRNAALLRRENGPGQQVVELPLVPSPRLAAGSDAPTKKTVDVLLFGTPNARREAVLEQLRAAGLSVELVAGAYAGELAPAVLRARLVLHVHFYESAYFPVARMLQPLARQVPVVCEDSVFSAHNDWSESGILFAPYDQLTRACTMLLADPEERRARAEQAWQFARRQDFATPLARLVQTLEARAIQSARGPGPLDRHDDNRLLTNEEIEEILAREAIALPEAGSKVAALSVVRREPGQGRFGRWVAWMLIAFMLLGIVASLR